LVLFTTKKLYTGFRFVPKSVTLNDLEHHLAVIMRYYTLNAFAFKADRVELVKAKHTMYVKKCSQKI